jgi:lysyl-tRNA synthetase class 2
MIAAATIANVWRDDVVGDGKLAEFLLLASFLLSWGFIRLSTHMIRAQVSWWPGNVRVKGTHVHHLVFGILTILVVGYAGIAFAPGSPWRELCAVAFGIGMGLTLDEFALWLELRDVYWLPEGRKSIDAVIATAVVGLLLLVGARIWIDAAHGTAQLAKVVIGGSLTAGLVLGVVNALRGHLAAAIVSLIVPVAGVAFWVLMRPRPHSIWARVWTRHVTPHVPARHRRGATGPPAPVPVDDG